MIIKKIINKKNQKFNFFYSIFIYSIILLPIAIISGPFLTDLLISILALSFFIYVREEKFFYNYFFIFSLLFYLIILLSSTLSENKFLSFESSLFYFRFFCFSLMFWFLIENNRNILKYFFYILLFCFTALIFDSFLQYLTGFNSFNMKLLEQNRVSSFFGDELKMGGYLARLFPLLLGLSFFFYKKKFHQKYLNFGLIFILLIHITIFLSGERTSFFLFNLIIIFLLIFLNNFNFQKILFLIIYIITTLVILSTDSPFKQRIIDLTIKQIKKESSYKGEVFIFSKQYHEHYSSSWNMFKDNMLIGIGPKNFREICKKKKYNFSELTCSTHPHNTYFQILSETGLFGFVIIFIVNLIVWLILFKNLFNRIFYKKTKISNFQISLLIFVAICLWPFAPSGSFFNNWNSAIYYLPIGILLWSFRYNNELYTSKKIKKKYLQN